MLSRGAGTASGKAAVKSPHDHDTGPGFGGMGGMSFQKLLFSNFDQLYIKKY
jgi:hypothetical protein